MAQKIEFHLPPELGLHPTDLESTILKHYPELANTSYLIHKRSIDARKVPAKIRIELDVFTNLEELKSQQYQFDWSCIKSSTKKIIIIGAGPAGLFAALKCLENGFKPIIIERGKDVRARRRDLADIQKNNIVNPDSNYCFGEGGAGTYSDGKLYTRSGKRGDIKRILDILVKHGANQDILFDAHPHIGTNKLPKLIASIRETILNNGGEILFETRVVDFNIKGDKIESIFDQNGKEHVGDGFILVTGHSARDIYHLLNDKKVLLEPKPFAMGVRIEHPQYIIDEAQYKTPNRGEFLPPAAYSLVHQTNYKGVERGVFSFCMCPGGFIVPSATTQNELVVNGMSPSKRDSKYANSGTVVAINLEDMDIQKEGIFAGLNLQSELEQIAWKSANATQTAPSQRLIDFCKNKSSINLPDCSYIPGILSVPLNEVLPPYLKFRLQEGIKAFGQKMKGYYTNEAILVGVESRTSSPVRIPRLKDTLQHPEITNLFPGGEGAGYAGGIVSAAIDGEKLADACANFLLSK